MRKFRLLGFLLVAVCAFSAVVTASAFALTFALANWLENGNVINAEKLSDIEGELLFVNLENGVEFLCSGIFDGSVGANGVDEVTEILKLDGVTVVPELDEAGATGGIACTTIKTCIANKVEIWPNNLPYKTELMLDTEDGLFYDLTVANNAGLWPGYFVLCEVIPGIDSTELCLGLSDLIQEKSNNTTAGDVELLGVLTPEVDCGPQTGTGHEHTEVGILENNAQNVALILLVNNATLAVSE
jgi:hypothetical protein